MSLAAINQHIRPLNPSIKLPNPKPLNPSNQTPKPVHTHIPTELDSKLLVTSSGLGVSDGFSATGGATQRIYTQCTMVSHITHVCHISHTCVTHHTRVSHVTQGTRTAKLTESGGGTRSAIKRAAAVQVSSCGGGGWSRGDACTV